MSTTLLRSLVLGVPYVDKENSWTLFLLFNDKVTPINPWLLMILYFVYLICHINISVAYYRRTYSLAEYHKFLV